MNIIQFRYWNCVQLATGLDDNKYTYVLFTVSILYAYKIGLLTLLLSADPWLSVFVWCTWCGGCSLRGRQGEALLLDVLLLICWPDTCKLSIVPNLQREINKHKGKIENVVRRYIWVEEMFTANYKNTTMYLHTYILLN